MLAVARELPVFRPIPYVVEVDGQRRETGAMLVAVANGPSYGGGMRVCPDAVLDDGLLDVLVLSEISIPAFLRVFPRVFAGTHVRHPAVEVLRGQRVRLVAKGVVAYADGERVGPLPLTCAVVPGALRVLVPGCRSLRDMSSPAQRYAAATHRQRLATSQLGHFTVGLDFPLDDFQVRACEAVEQGRGVLVAAPTGAGKTIVGEFAVFMALATGRKAFYTTPIKALSNQKYADLVRRHGAENVGLLTGDSSVNGEAPVVVMTTWATS